MTAIAPHASPGHALSTNPHADDATDPVHSVEITDEPPPPKLAGESRLEKADAHIGAGRALYRRVAEDNDAPLRLRLQALTNLGNNYDHVGRDLEALDCYDQALALDPTFAMAWGNHGMTLTHVAPWMGEHRPTVLHQGLRGLDRALSDRDGVLAYGGEAALRSFEAKRAQFNVETQERPDESPADVRWTDPYLEWVRQHNLFLHVSPSCLREDTADLDPLFFRSIVTGLSDQEQQRINTLVDAFNTLKQDYITSRYLLWLSTSPDSPIREHTSSTSGRTKFLDSLSYARWGIRTGTAIQAFSAAVNLLDKTASFVHLYLRSPRLRDVYFTTLWHRRNAHSQMDPTVSAEISAGNRGLLALCDLSSDVRRDTGLSERLGRRHAATHRFLVAHWMGVDEPEAAQTWLERVDWSELVKATIQQLHVGRAALLYLARTIDIRERRNAPRPTPERPLPTLQIYRAETEQSDFD